MSKLRNKIAFQGELGAYSHQAVVETFPNGEATPYPTFDAAIRAVERGEASHADR